MLKRWLSYSAVTLVAASSLFAETPARVQIFPLHETTGLVTPPKAKTEAVKYQGRKCVRLTIDGDDNDGLALLPGTDFQDGVIEADIALKTTVPPGVRYPGFVGIAFRVRPDASHYELFYLRPGNSVAADQAMRNHSVQYSSEPDFGWYRLRREWPWVYESHVDVAQETWTKLRIEVAGRAAKLYLNGSSQPSLVVDGLKGEDLHGAVGLWGFTDEEAYFSNVRITPAAPQNLKNGADIAGSWDMRYSNDVSGMDATMEIAPRRKQSDRNLVRPAGRVPRHQRHLAQRLRGTLLRRRVASRQPQRSSRPSQRLPHRLDRRRLRQGTHACRRPLRRRLARPAKAVSASTLRRSSGAPSASRAIVLTMCS